MQRKLPLALNQPGVQQEGVMSVFLGFGSGVAPHVNNARSAGAFYIPAQCGPNDPVISKERRPMADGGPLRRMRTTVRDICTGFTQQPRLIRPPPQHPDYTLPLYGPDIDEPRREGRTFGVERSR